MFSSNSISRRGSVSAATTVAPRSRTGQILSQVLRLVSWSGGAACFVWAYSDSRFRDAEGFLEGKFCLPIAAGVALMILGWAVTGRFRKFAFWFALALTGQAVALQMIDAGPLIHYQHYRSLPILLTGWHSLLLIYLMVQTALVAAGLKNRWPSIRSWLQCNFKTWQWTGVCLVLVLSGAAATREITIYLGSLAFAALVQIVNLANIVLMVWALPEDAVASLKRRFEQLFGQAQREIDGEPGGVDSYAALAAVWVIAVAAILAFYSYERHPHVPDEVIYLQHARYLATGALTLAAPPSPDAFSLYLMETENGKWYASPPPGWPAVLALGILFGAPWLVNPVLAGINVLLAYVLMREIYDRRTARWVVLLLCVSPWHIFMAMNFMTHTATLTCALVAAVGVAWARRFGKARWAWLAGGAVGMASLIRPLDGLIVASVLGLWAIGLGGRRLKLSAIAAFVLGIIITGAIVLPYNKLLTGDPTVFPLQAYIDKHFGPKANALGFGPDRGMGWALQPFPGHSPLGAIVNANLNIFSLNIELFGWSTGSLIMMALLLFSGATRRSDYLMLAVIAAVFGTHFFYWYSGGPDFGARYWYLILVPCVVLTARGILFLQGKFETALADRAAQGARVTLAVLALCVITLVAYFPWRAIDKYHHYLRMRPDVRYLAEEYDFGRSLVLIRGPGHPDYASAAVYNPLDLRADVPVYAWDRNDEVRAQVLKAYADRPVWIIDGPSVTHAGFKVVKGPLPARDLMAAEENRDR